jgi:hypothetical protein
MGPGLIPDRVTECLGVHPTRSHRRGENRPGPRATQPWQEGLWLLEAPCDPHDPIRVHLEWILDRLESHRMRIDDFLQQGCRADIYVSYALHIQHSGPTFDQELLKRLARFAVPVGLSIYGGP